MQALLFQVAAQLLDARLVFDRRMGVLLAPRPFEGILAVPAVHPVEVLRLGSGPVSNLADDG